MLIFTSDSSSHHYHSSLLSWTFITNMIHHLFLSQIFIINFYCRCYEFERAFFTLTLNASLVLATQPQRQQGFRLWFNTQRSLNYLFELHISWHILSSVKKLKYLNISSINNHPISSHRVSSFQNCFLKKTLGATIPSKKTLVQKNNNRKSLLKNRKKNIKTFLKKKEKKIHDMIVKGTKNLLEMTKEMLVE